MKKQTLLAVVFGIALGLAHQQPMGWTKFGTKSAKMKKAHMNIWTCLAIFLNGFALAMSRGRRGRIDRSRD